MKVIVELDYSKNANGGPISIQSITVLNSSEHDVTQKYNVQWVYGYNYVDKNTLKKRYRKRIENCN